MPDRARLSLLSPSRPRRAVVGALLMIMLGASGCSRSVAIDDPVPPGPALAVCDALMAALPATVLDQSRRTVEPGRYAAAWGDPTITLRCGVARPAPSTQCAVVNDVDWTVGDASGGAVFTSFGRTAYVQVGVPDAYAPEATALVSLAAVVTDHNPLQQRCP